MDIEGAGAIVTGAASGMGLATARRLSQGGARVALLDINVAGAKAAAAETGGIALPCDIADPVSSTRAVQNAFSALGQVRILVTCAAIARMEPVICDDDDATYARMVETIHVNLIGTLNIVRLVVNAMRRGPALPDGERGVVIMVASAAAYDGPPTAAAYAASKGGIVSMTIPLARELGDYGIRVNAISPGAVSTPMLAQVPPKLLENTIRSTPFPKRPGKADEFAELVLHICRNSFVNGSVIRLDGGLRIPYYSNAD